MTFMGSNAHQQLKPLKTEQIQRGLSMGSEQHMRPHFCDKLLQYDLDAFLPSGHLQIEPRRPTLDSFSSVEVNVDLQEFPDQMDMLEEEDMDIFLSSCGDKNGPASPFAGNEVVCTETEDDFEEKTSLSVAGGLQSRCPMLSFSSASTDPTSEEGEETPTPSDDEDEHTDVPLLKCAPPTDNSKKEDPACLI